MARLIDASKLVEEFARRDTTDGTVKVFSGREICDIICMQPEQSSKSFETIAENVRPTRSGIRCTEELIKIEFLGTELVRCKECKHLDTKYCPWDGLLDLNGFCSRGERKEVE